MQPVMRRMHGGFVLCYMHLCRYQSNYWLLPNPDVFGAGTVLASTPTRNYTALDYDAFFADAGCVTHVVLLFCIFRIGNNTSAVLETHCDRDDCCMD